MDLIDRQAAIEAVSKGCQEWRGIFGRCEENILALPSAQPECDKKFVMLKVIDLNDRPYYSIIYLEDGREYEGYSSYDLMVISEYLKRYFGFAQPEQQWIPCSERLPFAEYGESDKVLTTCGNRVGKDTGVRWIRLLYFNGVNWCYPTGEMYEQKVYAWMPMPEPYREDDHETD